MIEGKNLVSFLKNVVRYIVLFLAIAMVIVIFWCSLEAIALIYHQAVETPFLQEGQVDLLTVFGSFLTVLIAIEIFLNIILYLERNMFHVQLVVATALTAVVRKVIVLDYSSSSPLIILGIAAVVLAVGITYWITFQKPLPGPMPETSEH